MLCACSVYPSLYINAHVTIYIMNARLIIYTKKILKRPSLSGLEVLNSSRKK